MSTQKESKIKSFFQDLLLGGTAGTISKTVGAPLERVKLLLQLQQASTEINKKYTSFSNCFVRIYKEEGVLAYWRGNWANIVRYFPTTALNFAFKDYFNKKFKNSNPNASNWDKLKGNILAGGLAGVSCMTFVYPLDFARTRMGVDVGLGKNRQFNSLSDCLVKIFQKDGVKGLYSGFPISAFSIFIYRGLYFGFYDFSKVVIKDYDNMNFFKKLLVAQLVTNFSETLSYPFDTVRRRLMMNSGKEVKIYNNSMHCFKEIYSKEGFTGFFKGNLSNMMRSLTSSLVLVLYDELKNKFIKKK